MSSMNAAVNAFLLVYAALFPIVNPIADAPLFLGLTQFCTDAQRNLLARRVALNSFFLLVGSLFVGSHVLEFFGISLPVVRIGGGLVVSAFGWKLLNAEPSPDVPRVDPNVRATIPDPFYPLTMPLTVGPGSISVAITLGTQLPKIAGAEQLLFTTGAAVAASLAMALTVYFSYLGFLLVADLGVRHRKVDSHSEPSWMKQGLIKHGAYLWSIQRRKRILWKRPSAKGGRSAWV